MDYSIYDSRCSILQWRCFTTPLSKQRVHSATLARVHGAHLYLVAMLDKKRSVMYRCQNLKKWFVIPTPPNTQECHGLHSHGDHLYALWETAMPAGGQPLLLYRLDGSVWKALPNARLPKTQLMPAFSSLSKSLILVGGATDDVCLDLVQEYSLIEEKWLEVSAIPPLPKPVCQTSCFTIGGAVHILGGHTFTKSGQVSNHTVFSMLVENDTPVTGWLQDVFPPTPEWADGQNILENLVVASGSPDFDRPCRISVYDGENAKWLSLPILSVMRPLPSVCILGNTLCVFGSNGIISVDNTVEFLEVF